MTEKDYAAEQTLAQYSTIEPLHGTVVDLSNTEQGMTEPDTKAQFFTGDIRAYVNP